MFLRVGARCAGVTLAALVLLVTPAAAQRSAAETIAEKFSDDAEAAQRKAEEQRKKGAEIKAMEALREQARKRAEEALKAERSRELKAQAGQIRKPVPAAQPAEPIDPKAEENDMLARAREDAERLHAQGPVAPGPSIEQIIAARTAQADAAAAQARAKVLADARRTWQRSAQRIAAQEREVAESEARVKVLADARRAWHRSAQRIAAQERDVAEAEARAKVLVEARRTWQRSAQRLAAQEREFAEAEARAKVLADARRAWHRSVQRIAAQEREVAQAELRAAEAQRSVSAAPATQPAPTTKAPETASVTARTPPSTGAEPLGHRVTVLLMMQPGNKGIRRHNKSGDPVLCVNGGCYVSSGADAPAQFMPGRQALGLANTWGGRAGACRNQLGCVFRSVAVADLPLLIQPIDLRVVKHDRRHMAAISTDSHCRLDAGRLSCTRGIVEDDYVMWVVPEALAEAAGAAILDSAVSVGLTGPQSALAGER